MRSIINVSIPNQTNAQIKKLAKDRGFSNISEYFRYLLTIDENLITPEQLLQYSRQASSDYAKGKLKKYSSLAEL